jgi:hypothetical protein
MSEPIFFDDEGELDEDTIFALLSSGVMPEDVKRDEDGTLFIDRDIEVQPEAAG